MSKSKNIKRMRLLKKKKNERRQLENSKNIPESVNRLKSKIEKRGESKITYNKDGKIKVSELIPEMVSPLMDMTENFEQEKRVIGLGVMAWNIGVVKITQGEKEMNKMFKKLKEEMPNEVIDMIKVYVEVKCTEYKEYNQFIHSYDFTETSSTMNHLTVAHSEL